MTAGGLWKEIGAGENILTKFLRLIFLIAAAVSFCFLAALPLPWPQQAVCGLLILLLSLALARLSDSYLITLSLLIVSMFCTFRYGYWRLTQTVRYFQDPASHWGLLDAFFILSLLLAEIYYCIVLFLGYFQTIWPLRRAPVPMPDSEQEWPDVDVLIPTYNEPLEVVRYTAFGALNLDWPADKLHVYLLDDGRRPEFARFASEAGIGYKKRTDKAHAKAGNINAALKTIRSPYVAVFDCDHVPTRSFLQMTVGWMLHDAKLAMVQTPHHLYSPDPFERNLDQFRTIPSEGELFYGIVQDGNDLWNATFFCGSCAVLRRQALDEVGGISVESVTEDAHTSLRMQMKGWNTAYINIPQAAGLATERLSAHVRQRIRWARGMVQILRTDNPLFARGLSVAQRFCYFNAMFHFLYALPRLVFLTAPLVYLLLNHTILPGYWVAILVYAMPHLALSTMTRSRMQGEHRHSFWNEIFETVLAPYIFLPTMMALIHPRAGKFNVTAKGGLVKNTFMDARIAQPFLVMLGFNLLGLLVAALRLFLWDRDRPGTVLINAAWCLFNILILGVCAAVSRELKQRRTTVRIPVVSPLSARLSDGRIVRGQTIDMSPGGASVRFLQPLDVNPQAHLRLVFPPPAANIELPATVMSIEGSVLRLRFENLSIVEQEVLTMVLYSRADSWLAWSASREPDNVLRSFRRVLSISMLGLKHAAQNLLFGKYRLAPEKTRETPVARSAVLLMLAAVSCGAACLLNAQTVSKTPANAASAKPIPIPEGHYRDHFTLAEAGVPPIDMHGVDSRAEVHFTLPQTHVVRSATLHLHSSFSASLLPKLSQIKLYMNGTLFATSQPTPNNRGGSDSSDAQADFAIPPELLVHSNTLTIQFTGHTTQQCEDPGNPVLWARVQRDSFLDIEGSLLAMADDLKLLPAPFLDPAVVRPLTIPIVFPDPPSFKQIQAAGVVSSYFGMISANRPLRFPVHIGDLPQGNSIIVATTSADLPPSFNLGVVTVPTVAMRTNPLDPYGKVLIIVGADADQTLLAAQAVALHSDMLAEPEAQIGAIKLPPQQNLNAAPRWARTDQLMHVSEYGGVAELQTDGSSPLMTYFRLPPDTFLDPDRPNPILHISYRYNSIPIAPTSSLQVRVNNALIGSVPLVPANEAARAGEEDFDVPVSNLRPFSNSLSFGFAFQPPRKGGCQDSAQINMQGSILQDTYLDLRGFPHYVALPNLELFANAGFPFTRRADLSDTTVVLPAKPTREEIETFVTLTGHFSRQTGFPALRVTVAGTDALRTGAGADFLILGAGDDQPAFDTLNGNLPVAVQTGKMQIHDTPSFLAPLHNAWWKLNSYLHLESGDPAGEGVPASMIEAIKSPFDPGGERSIVVIHLKDAAAFVPFMASFLRVQQSSAISGSVAVLHGSDFKSFRVGGNAYHIGVLAGWTRLILWLTQVPWLAPIIILVLAFLLAIWLRQGLRRKAIQRLTIPG